MGEKSIAMLPQKELLPNTGYVHGGCSPVGMRKQYPTVFHETAEILDTITVSAGKIGYQVELAPSDPDRPGRRYDSGPDSMTEGGRIYEILAAKMA